MKTTMLFLGSLALASLTMASLVHADEPSAPSVAEAAPAIPPTPAAVNDLVYARKFTVTNGYEFRWCKEKRLVTSGYLLVLKVNPDLVYARQCAEPVLYVGDQTAQRLNNGYRSGHVVAIAPGHPDLSQTLIWFGTPELPERVDTATANAELNLAKAAGIQPFSAKAVQAAQERASGELNASTTVEVLEVAAELIRTYAPDEENVAKTCVPATKVAPKAEESPAKD